MEKRKIGLVTTWFERGAAYVSKQYVDALKSDFDVFIYVRGGEKYAIDDPNWNADNLYWGKRFKYLAGSYINLEDFRNWLILNKIEIAFFNEQHNWSPIIACSKLGILTGAYIDYYKKDTVKLFNSYDFVICNTKRHFSVFENHEQSFYVPWGTDVNLFSPKPKPKKFQDRIVFFHSAGMNPKRKGTDLVIRAANQIKDSQFHLLIHTQTDLKDFFPEITNIVERLILNKKLTIINKTIAAPGIYHYGDIYLYPTRLEGIGLTVPEALSCGLPVITTNQAPMNEFVIEGINGKLALVDKVFYRGDNYYWPQSNVNLDSLKNCIEWYIEKYHEIDLLRKNARSYALDHLDWTKNTSDLKRIFNEVRFIESKNKKAAIDLCEKIEKKVDPFSILNSFLPYIRLKRKLKRLIK